MGDGLVECHSGYTYAQRPVALRWQSVRLEIELVEAEWKVPQGRCFRVRTKDQQQFELIYLDGENLWRITPA